MLYIVLPIVILVCLSLAFLGVTLCRLAARSDVSDAIALAEWIEATERAREALASRAATATPEALEPHATRRAAG